MTSVLILGAYGFLGSVLSPYLAREGYVVLRQGRRASAEVSFNPLDDEAFRNLFRHSRFDVIINLIAATDMDKCEMDCQWAYQANTLVVETLVHAINDLNNKPHLIQISTDHVYNGPGPHKENIVSPNNVYAISKLAGEIAATNLEATILRTNFLGQSCCEGRISLTDWIINSLGSGKNITVFDDVLISSLHLKTLCSAIELVIRKRYPGVYNLGCQDGGSKADLAFGLAKRLHFNESLMTIGCSRNAKFLAKRSLDMRMDSQKFEISFDFPLPTFESQIDLTAQEYMNEKNTM